MIRVTVEFWGPAGDLVDVRSIELSLGRSTRIGTLKTTLVTQFPRLGTAANFFRFAVNEEFVPEDRELMDGDVVAVIPPVSGG